MKVIVDTSVWALALRRHEPKENEYVFELKELIKEVRAQLIGPVRQEVLNGIKSKKQFNLLKKHLNPSSARTIPKLLANAHFSFHLKIKTTQY